MQEYAKFNTAMVYFIQSLRAFRRAGEWVARYDIVNCTDAVRDGVTIANFSESLKIHSKSDSKSFKNQSKIDQQSIKNLTEIDQKSIENRSKIDQKRGRSDQKAIFGSLDVQRGSRRCPVGMKGRSKASLWALFSIRGLPC